MVLLQETESTPFDLSWRMFGIPVRVNPWFWIMSALLGWELTQRGLLYLLLWMLAVFVSVLIHELGHVFMGRLFGSRGHIFLYSFGGLAIGSNNLRQRWQRVAVLFAGPLTELALGGLVWLGLLQVEDRLSRESLFFANVLMLVSVFWALLNLLPIWPLDGGQISREAFTWLNPREGVRLSLVVSLIVAGVLAVLKFGVLRGQPVVRTVAEQLPTLLRELWLWVCSPSYYMALYYVLFAVGSFQALQEESRRSRWGDDLPWER